MHILTKRRRGCSQFVFNAQNTISSSSFARYSALSLTRMWNPCYGGTIINEARIATISEAVGEEDQEYITRDYTFKGWGHDDPAHASQSDRGSSRVIAIVAEREKLVIGAAGGCGCICGRDTRKWRLRPVRINWKWAVRADTTVLISSTTWRTRASPPCTPRCLLRSSSREPTLRLPCTSRTPVSFLRSFLCFSACVTGASLMRWWLQMFDSLDFPRAFQQLNFPLSVFLEANSAPDSGKCDV